MSPATQLSETERQRMLQLMGFEVWVRRGSEPLRAATPVATPSKVMHERAGGTVASTTQSRARPVPVQRVAPRMELAQPAAATMLPRAAPSLRVGAQSVLLVLEKRVHADAPLIRQLMRTLPGCVVCTPDTVSRGTAKFALQVGVDAVLPADVLGVRGPELAVLQNSASARRALWWSIKPMLRALSGQ